jgi:hypothetical protein
MPGLVPKWVYSMSLQASTEPAASDGRQPFFFFFAGRKAKQRITCPDISGDDIDDRYQDAER